MKNHRIPFLALALMLILSACNLPSSQATEQISPNAVFTAAAQTVEAQLTQNSLIIPTNPPATVAPPPTSLPPTVAATALPIVTPVTTTLPAAVATSSCDAAQFVTDVTVPDGTQYSGGATFVKTWRLTNTGSCTWNSSYNLVFDSGISMGGPASQPLVGTIVPGASVDISVNLQAPATDNTYRGYWGLTNASGARIPVTGGSNGKSFYVEIKVGAGGSGDSSGGKFAVNSVGFSVTRSGTCASGKYVVTATITTNGPGEVTYKWIYSDGGTDGIAHDPLVFSAAGSQTVTTEWSTSASVWLDLYIDKPNHQQFARATLTCP